MMVRHSAACLADAFVGVPVAGDVPDLPLAGVALDSRRIEPGDLFIALAGERDDGLRHIPAAVAAGAVAICLDADRTAPADSGVPLIRVPALARWTSRIAANVFGDPSRSMRVIGVTGTNGKTSVAHVSCQLACAGARQAAFAGTLGCGPLDALEPTGLTTADAVEVQRRLAGFRSRAVDLVAMEVSSHALAQHRVDSVAFDVAVFTNLTRDHLDYHRTMAAYGEAKRALFLLETLRFAVINVDDAFGRGLIGRIPAAVRVLRYSARDATADVRVEALRTHRDGLAFALCTPWGRREIDTPLFGAMNAQNIALAVAALGALDHDIDQLAAAAHCLTAVPGRMERIGDGAGPAVFVDYAHTPDALDHALAAARSHARGRVIAVFGAGGDRDRGKRPLMGAAAAAHADRVVITDDNPRGEDGDHIAADVRAGIAAGVEVAIVRDREAAIRAAISAAGPDDVVVVAGKGHEDVQVVGGQRLPFHDPTVVARLLESVAATASNDQHGAATE